MSRLRDWLRLAGHCWYCDYPAWWHETTLDSSGWTGRYLWPHFFEAVGLHRALISRPWRDF